MPKGNGRAHYCRVSESSWAALAWPAGPTAISEQQMARTLRQLSPGSARDIITRVVEQLQNGMYDMPEDRPVWKILPVVRVV